jgi:hypothetical protein
MTGTETRTLEEWHEDDGPALWWKFPLTEPPYVGTPLDCPQVLTVTINKMVISECTFGGWPGYHTHWTPLPPAPAEPKESDINV